MTRISEQFNFLDLETIRGQRFNQNLPVFWPFEGYGIQSFAFLGKAQIGTGEWIPFRIIKMTGDDFGWTFAKNLPGPGLINGLAIAFQPVPNFQQDFLLSFRDGTIGTGANIEQQSAILADDID